MITSVTIRDMPLVLADYTIQVVWLFFKNLLISIIDRKTRITSGEDEMLPHVGS